MLDKWALKVIKPAIGKTAAMLNRFHITANQVTIFGFLLGMGAIPALWKHYYGLALGLIILNRMMDGIDGAIARLNKPSDAGGFLDICLDFLFYSGVVWGFMLADPQKNGFAAATLIYSFVGTGTSFLAFAILAAKRKISSIDYPQKSFYYLGGLTEGTETIVALCLFCLFPEHFPQLALIFAAMCWMTIISRIIGGFYTLKQISDQ